MTSLNELLRQTSRTFALCIPILPEPLAREIAIAYLLLRVADTFEDSTTWPARQRIDALDDFACLVANPSRKHADDIAARCARTPPTDNAAYSNLIAELPHVLTWFEAIEASRRAIITKHVLRSIDGMKTTIERSADGRLVLSDLAELREYCYFVAGIVGEMLTDLFCATFRFDAAEEAILRMHARAFGEGLQLVNVLKDSQEDAAEGRFLLPPHVPVVDIVALARADLAHADEYVAALAGSGARRRLWMATSLPVKFAYAALRRFDAEGPGAKVSRDEVRTIMDSIMAHGSDESTAKTSLDTRTKFMLATMAANGLSVVNAAVQGGWILASAGTVITGGLLVGYIVRHRDTELAKLGAFALAAGLTELGADAWAVQHGGLVYEQAGPFLWHTPLYMPFGWAVVLMQFGYVGHLLTRRFGLVMASIAVAAMGVTLIPSYEYFAAAARLWTYHGNNMLFGTVPSYVLAGELLIGLVLPVMVRESLRRSAKISLLLGVTLGAWMLVVALLAFRLCG